ncbi:MAG: hypothetical protein FWE95_05545 [Planctomycetaceae bacterium]|nr:hypothetical protein [Planctomycetaceae bacterium]
MRTIPFIMAFFAAAPLLAELVAPNGSQQLPNYRTSWLGNTYGGLNPATGRGQWVQQDIAAMHVTPDGTVYTNVPWEEAGGNCMMYKDGEMLGSARYTHGWGFNGGKAVAVNDKYVFIAVNGNNEGGGLNDISTWPPRGFDWYGVSRRLRSDFTKGAPFEHGKGGRGDTLPKSFLVINEVPVGGGIDGPGAITGLWATDERLYVSNPLENRIEIYDAETMLKVDEWDLTPHGFTEPGQIVADKDGNIWVHHAEMIQDTEWKTHTITQFNPEGSKMQGRVSGDGKNPLIDAGVYTEDGSPVSKIGAFCFGPDNTMYVFNGFLGILVSPPNEEGQYFANPRTIGSIGFTEDFFLNTHHATTFNDLEFGTSSVKAIGCDAEGNLYIAQDLATHGGGAILESYRLTGKRNEQPFSAFGEDTLHFLDAELRWRLFGLCFIDCATLDPDDETIVFTKEEKYRLDWSQTEPGKEWSFIGMTAQYPDGDPRFNIKDSAGVWVRKFNEDSKLLFVNDMNAQWLLVYELHEMPTPSEKGEIGSDARFLSFFAGKKPPLADFEFFTDGELLNMPKENGEWIWHYDTAFDFQPGRNEPTAQGWWVDSENNIWRASEREGIRLFRFSKKVTFEGTVETPFGPIEARFESPHWSFANLDTFPHPKEFRQVKRIRYYPETDTLYLGGCAVVEGVEHKNQHWKPMGPVIARYDNFLKGDGAGLGGPGQTEGKLRWLTVLPYVSGSSGHESCEPMGFDVAGDYIFVPYTGASRTAGVKHGRVEVIRTSDASPVGWMEPDPKTVGEIGLQDIRECLSAHQLKNGEYVIFLEDDYKAKVVIYRWLP